MLQWLPTFLLPIALLLLVACSSREESTPTTESATATPKPTTTKPEPTATLEPKSDPAASPAGYWEGAIATSGIEILVNLDFAENDDGLSGTISIPQQRLADLPLDNITIEGEQIHFEHSSIGAIFDGTVTAESIAGEFEQGAATGTFEVTAGERVEEETTDAVVDLPYIVEEVTWDIDDTTVAATLTQPEGNGPFPAIIMVAGSGPTDRDWNSPLIPGSNGSAALLADALTRAGYVTLRYDKRASGPNVATNMEKLMGQLSLQSHLDELAGGMALLADQETVDAGNIFALANSEGAIHALNYQLQAAGNPLAGLILAAPPGRALKDVLRSQLEPQFADFDIPEELLALYDEAMERFFAGEAIEPSPDLPPAIQQLLLGLEAPANLPFARELFVVDPAVWLAEIDAPVLVLIGKKDVQIDWQIDGGRLEEAVKGSETVTFDYPDNANHVFKYEEKPAAELTANDSAHYNSADRFLDEQSLTAIMAWLATR